VRRRWLAQRWRLPTALVKRSGLDWVRVGLLLAGLLCVATGLLPADEAERNIRRIAPLLLFLASVIVLANLAKQAQVFDVIATRLAIIGRGNYLALFLLCVAFASATTAFLNLDTTAVLLTPVLLALAGRAEIAPVPLAMTTIWLANTASLLLPVSNLTNLLAADRITLSAPAFAARMWLPAVTAIAATMIFLWICYWRRRRRGRDRYISPAPLKLTKRGQPVLFRITGAACLLFIVAIPIVGDQIGLAALAAASIAVLAFAVLDRRQLTMGLIPWQLLILVTGLFLVVPTLSRHGLSDVMSGLIGTGRGEVAEYRAATAGVVLSNALNNLPAYTAGEAVIPKSSGDVLLALLIGTNVGPIITPWASLATLLCLESCRRYGLRIRLGAFVLAGAGLAVVGLVLSVGALRLTS